MLWQYQFGKPKDLEVPADRPPIVFLSAHGPPGSYDPLAKPPVEAEVLPHARSLAAGGPIEGPAEDDGSLVIVR